MDLEEEEAQMNAEASGSGSPGSVAVGEDGKISKSAQKKAAKQARMEALRPQRRLAEKIRRKERAAVLSEGYANGTLSEADRAIVEQRRQVMRDRKRAMGAAREGGTEGDWKGGVIIDLGFDGLMTDQEITSMVSQLSYVFSYNRTAPRPISTVLHTSFSPAVSPRLWEKMTKANWDKWTRSYWWEQGLGDLSSALTSTSKIQPSKQEVDGTVPSSTNRLESCLSGPNLPPTLRSGQKLVYLSADSEDELTKLSEDEIYIIGGIVDRNRHKNLCQNKAEKLEIRTARLPIGTYLEDLPTRKVLTVNQVFAILVQYIALESWSEAFEAVIPQRKYQPGKKSRRSKKGIAKLGEEVGDDVDDDDGSEEGCGPADGDEINEEDLLNA